MNEIASLLEKIEAREANIGIIGLGYVGLPLGMTFAEAGFAVTGFDVDERKVLSLQNGESYIKHIPNDALEALTVSGKLRATMDFSRARGMDCLIICVPTPLTRAREPDVSYIVRSAEALVPAVRVGQLFVLESTSYPGTTEEVLKPVLERSGLKAGVDFHLAFSPEREDPGNKRFSTKDIPKIVGGLTPRCLEVAQVLYGTALSQTVAVSSTRVAELAKLLENIFRSVNIALVNEFKMLCDRMELDVWEVIQAASTKPFGFMPFSPGPGLGGHCIPIDPFYLTWKAREYQFQTKFIELAGEVNTQMPFYVVQRMMEALNRHRKSINGSKLLVLGASYKKDVDDPRESPALKVISLLKERGAIVSYHDPFVAKLEREHGIDFEMSSTPLSMSSLGEYDGVLILTDHSTIDYSAVVQHARLVLDTRNATRKVTRHREKIVKA
jgi:UDP-N-acetyl-D-glucosamine dehydrogenase